ncbi:uncharacterized protein [Aegilops tauschii subsp. strangulata]|uniref:RWD domain-containing protein n=1 Tax=Aegilops tauschii subsp. strangulata TaxID=200361 RepID=A0A453B8A8_AEGTS|nr:E3 ubiquitin-protein ligase RNF14-like [Aegilops tauschii subsp. strangulata]
MVGAVAPPIPAPSPPLQMVYVLTVYNKRDKQHCIQIHVHREIPDGISVPTELQSVDDYPDNQFTFSVKHLAPISLTCLMPPSYLSHHPPYFFLSVQWLDTVKVSTLCHMLESIWAHQSAQEVVFEWVQGFTLSHLGFDGGIIIRMSDSTMAPVDARVVGEILSVEDVVQRLINYDEEQCLETFIRGLHVCAICFSEHPDNSDAPFDSWILSLLLISQLHLHCNLNLLF